jgi:two-component system chemotaxis response regulator CheB
MSENDGIVRVIIADDSEIAATYLERLLEQDPHIRVVGRARNGAELVALPARHIAHVVLLDVLMPEVGGLSVIRHLSGQCSTIVVSSVERGSQVEAEALALGACAFFNKRDLARRDEAARLREIVKSIGNRRLVQRGRIVFVVGSTGAIPLLENLIHELEGLAVPLLVVQHLPEGKDAAFSSVLSTQRTRARIAQHGDTLAPGVFIAPAGRHMEIDATERIRLFNGPAVHGHRPSGEVLLRSAVRLGSRALCIMLSGLADDGSQAMAAAAEHGALCLAEDPRDCHAASMPQAALAASPKVRAVRAEHLASFVRKAIGR